MEASHRWILMRMKTAEGGEYQNKRGEGQRRLGGCSWRYRGYSFCYWSWKEKERIEWKRRWLIAKRGLFLRTISMEEWEVRDGRGWKSGLRFVGVCNNHLHLLDRFVKKHKNNIHVNESEFKFNIWMTNTFVNICFRVWKILKEICILQVAAISFCSFFGKFFFCHWVFGQVHFVEGRVKGYAS